MAKPFCCWIQISAEEKPFHNDPGVKYSAGGSAIHSNPGFPPNWQSRGIFFEFKAVCAQDEPSSAASR
jgi:hypothetical protein